MRAALSLLLSALLVAGCATTRAGPNGLADRDPNEGFNRGVWEFNEAIDTVAIRPVSEVYRTVTPRPARRGLSRILANLTEPWSFVNNLLQGKPDRALRNLGRFVVNTTIGVGGLADHATGLGIEEAPEDFGQTLAEWGVGDGGYFVNPLLGPSTARDTVGSLVGLVANPTSLIFDQALNLTNTEQTAIRAVELVNTRANLTESGYDDFLESSADPYAAARSAFFQTRDAAIADEASAGLPGDGAEAESDTDAALDAAIEELESDQPLPPGEGAEAESEPDAALDPAIEEPESAEPQTPE